MSRYICHLRRRNGRTQTELDMHEGGPPCVGSMVNVVVADETVPGRIGSFSVDPSKAADGDPIIHVYVDEID
jgi:hypothetical protein